MNLLITGACGVTPRAIVRSLKMSPYFRDARIVGTDLGTNPYGIYEGLFDRIYRAPGVKEENYGAWMKDLCDREQIDAAIVAPELEVLYWSANPLPVPTALPPAEFCRVAISKMRLYKALEGTGLVPEFTIVSRGDLMARGLHASQFPCWIRDFGEGSTSGKGALLAANADDAQAWAVLNPGIEGFMSSEYLPGRNFATFLLYDNGTLIKTASYERLEYFMGRIAVSGISGNISRGRLLHDDRLVATAAGAVDVVIRKTGETMHGLVAVDMRENVAGAPLITEINLRHVAATSAFAQAGFNLAEAQLLVALGRAHEAGALHTQFPESNAIFRDIDGAPVWVPNYQPLAVGEMLDKWIP